MKRVIVCAAIRNKEGFIICGARHYDGIMHSQLMASTANWSIKNVEQGFIDQRGVFLTREEAYVVAKEANQIVRVCGGDEGKLFSENLY